MPPTDHTAGVRDVQPQHAIAARTPNVRPWLALLSMMFGLFMVLMDVTIVNVALNEIQTRLQTDLTTVSWVLNAYNLGFAVLLVTMGRLADLFGRKRMFLFGMIMFSLGSLLCGLAPNIGFLIAARALQSIGAAAINPISLAIITHIFPPQIRGRAIGIWGAAIGAAAAAGPLLGGILVEMLNWRWIFFVNLPFCVAGIIMVLLFVPESRDQEASKRVDIPGVVVLTASLFCLVLAIIQGSEWGLTSLPILGLLIAFAVGLIAFVLIEKRQAEPIVRFSLFKIRSFAITNVNMFLANLAAQGAFLLLVLFYTKALGFDPMHAALFTIGLPLTELIAASLSNTLGRLIGPARTAALGMALISIGMLLLLLLPSNPTAFEAVWHAAVIGAGVGLAFSSFSNLSLMDVPPTQLGMGSGIYNTFMQVGATMGVTILISLFTLQSHVNIAQAQQQVNTAIQAESRLPQSSRTEIVQLVNEQTTHGDQTVITNWQLDTKALAQKQTSSEAKAAIDAAQQTITQTFKDALVSAFKNVWVIASIIGLVNVALILLNRSGKKVLR
uniref:MFS transporter n=1 Tax=Thermosporothrix sp. COM3 TaxID=2490863 RepID=A0A455SAX6_9CHLR|nr:MFS transporter [Thermosporothrix sp. COM3]